MACSTEQLAHVISTITLTTATEGIEPSVRALIIKEIKTRCSVIESISVSI